jgi:trigger factor
LTDLGQISVEKPVASIEDNDVDQMFEKLRQQRATWAQVDRAAQDQDQIVIDFEGSIDGKPFDGGSGSKMNLVLGSRTMIDGFEDQLLNAGTGEHRSLNVTFPSDYNSQELAGKDAVFEVDVISVSEPVLPEVDDEFAKGFGVETGLESFRGEVRNTMERELEQAIRAKVKNNVLDALFEANKIDIPKSFVEDEITRMQEQMQQQMQETGNPASGAEPELPRSFFEEQAQKRVGLSLLIAEFAKSNAVQVDEEMVRSTIENLASSYEQPEQVIQHYNQNPSLMESVRGLVMEELVVERLLESVNVTEKSTTFDAVMNPKQA